MNGTKVCEKGLDVTNLLKLSPRIYSGHFHLRDRRDYQSSFVCYVGNPFEMNFGDINSSKGIYVLDLKTDTSEFIQNNISPTHFKLFASEILNKDLKKYKPQITNNIVKIVVDTKISADVIDKLQQSIIIYKPAVCTVEYLLDINAIDMLQDISSSMSGVNIENSITDFVNNLEIPNKEELIEECLSYYKDIK